MNDPDICEHCNCAADNGDGVGACCFCGVFPYGDPASEDE